MLAARALAALSTLCAAVVVAACAADTTSSSGAVAKSLGSGSCASAQTACPVNQTQPAVATPPPACTTSGSGRTDDFKQQVSTTKQADGLQIGDIKVGDGPQPRTGQLVTVAYSGWLSDGTLFDSSRKPGAQPFAFQLGSGGAIAGFEEAVATMHVGGIRRAVIPPALGYGPQGQGPIPPNATLTFDLELLCAA